MAKAEQVKSKRDMLMERMQKRHPDTEWADDEALMGQIGDDYDDYDKRIEEYQGSEKALTDLFNSDHRSAAFLTAWRDGKDPAVALMELFGDDIIEAINDPAKMEEISKARETYLKRVEEESKNNETYKENLAKSLQAIEGYQQEKGLDDEAIDNVMSQIVKTTSDVVMGKIEPGMLDMYLKAQNYDQDVATAQADGEVKGRNAKIEEKLRKQQAGDGTADLAGKNGGSGQQQMPDLGALGNYGAGNTTIYERGGEKRRPVRR